MASAERMTMLSTSWRMQNIPEINANGGVHVSGKGRKLKNQRTCFPSTGWTGGRGAQLYLVVLVLDSKSLTQVPEHLRAVFLKFELSRKILPKNKKRNFIGFHHLLDGFNVTFSLPKSSQQVCLDEES